MEITYRHGHEGVRLKGRDTVQFFYCGKTHIWRECQYSSSSAWNKGRFYKAQNVAADNRLITFLRCLDLHLPIWIQKSWQKIKKGNSVPLKNIFCIIQNNNRKTALEYSFHNSVTYSLCLRILCPEVIFVWEKWKGHRWHLSPMSFQMQEFKLLEVLISCHVVYHSLQNGHTSHHLYLLLESIEDRGECWHKWCQDFPLSNCAELPWKKNRDWCSLLYRCLQFLLFWLNICNRFSF